MDNIISEKHTREIISKFTGMYLYFHCRYGEKTADEMFQQLNKIILPLEMAIDRRHKALLSLC